MENIFKLLKQLMGTFSILGSIPKPIKMGMTYFGVVIGTMLVFRYANLGQGEKTFLVVALVILGVVTGGYYAWKAWTDKQQSQQFGGGIAQGSAATPRSVSDPGQRARLDDMRKKFQSGVEAYKSRGKDLYKLPWYVIVGEPGSGKTEAVRHSNVGFPPGMQDEFQGVGGTINMNWWFTNYAVLLDTAGRLMFEDVKPGETSEWREFLGLLKKNRPNCPINGLFLVIPSDSLIKDSADDIQKKAGKIAQQLDVIQRVLDVRFPVFVAVTKCDKINGFREFFDGLTDPQLQHQMMGWSNPNPLDEPFKPELVENHLEQVAARLRRRRLALLRDPVPESEDGRRTDEVDSLYALPHSLELLSSRLRRYLETIFIAGEWSAKPLFLRGIYFSSSMREGAALDAELAEAIGVGVDELPEGKVWERERAFFLRDLFIDKVFREKGLVTRASNTRRMLRGQQIALYSFGFVSLAVFCVFAWLAMGSLRGGVKDQGDYWHAVSAAGWENQYWKDSIVALRGDGSFTSSIATNGVQVDGKPVPLGEFHAKLRDLAEKPLKKNLMFPGLADKYNQNRHKAQRIVFEAGIVRPLLEASRQKMMTHDDGDAGSAQRQPDALAGLIQLEADILSRGTGTNTGEARREAARKFLTVFPDYIVGGDLAPDTNLVDVMVWTYSTNEVARGTWPPRWLTGARGSVNSLAANPGINSGLDLFIRGATNSVKTYQADSAQISSLRDVVKAFADSEAALFAVAEAGVDYKFTEAFRAVQAARKELENQIAKASRLPLFSSGVLLAGAQQKFQAGLANSSGAALGRVREVNNAALAAQPGYPLFKDINLRLDTVQASLSDLVARLLQSGDLKEFQALDETCLADNSFAKRADLYARAEALMREDPFKGSKLIGLKDELLARFLQERAGAVETAAAAYSGKLKDKAAVATRYQLKLVEKAQSEKFFADYIAQAQQQLATYTEFPLSQDLSHPMLLSRLMDAAKQLRYITTDLASPLFTRFAVRDHTDWKPFVSSVTGKQAVARALLGDDNIPENCAISLEGISDATRSKDGWRLEGTIWRNMRLISDAGLGEAIRTDESTEKKLGEISVQQKVQLLLMRRDDDPKGPKFTNSTPEWGPIWLIHQYKGERDKKDPASWAVEFPPGDSNANGVIRLKLKFDHPLPDLDQWPVR